MAGSWSIDAALGSFQPLCSVLCASSHIEVASSSNKQIVFYLKFGFSSYTYSGSLRHTDSSAVTDGMYWLAVSPSLWLVPVLFSS